MTLVELLDRFMPFAGALWFGVWITRDMKRAMAQIGEMAERIKQLEAKLADKDTTDDDVREIGFEPESTEPLPLPSPLPSATARYRT